MSATKAILRWLFRQSILFLVILTALAFYKFAWPMLAGGAVQEKARTEWMSPDEIGAELSRLKSETLQEFSNSRSQLETLTGDALSTELEERRRDLADVRDALQEDRGLLAAIRPSAILERKKLELRGERLEAEIAVLELARGQEKRRAALRKLQLPTASDVATAKDRCERANAAAIAFNRLPYTEKAYRNLRYGAADNLTRAAKFACGSYKSMSAARNSGLKAAEAASAQYAAERARLTKAAGTSLDDLRSFSPQVTERTLRDLLLTALTILLALIAMPFLIRILFYFVLAPLAERRGSIKIQVPDSGDVPIPPADRSRVSIPVTLERGEELLVRQDYLQSSSLSGAKSTRWLLDYRHVLSSLASGLSFLTRVRGEGEVTTVSAVRDPLAELTALTLPPRSACVLHPRALVAVVQPIGQPLRITSHWRLFSLNAWLTMQLRFLVFHGPARLIVKGGRGIRVEPAERGRIFGQDQLVGFSADLAYSVTRTETFAPYFFGREQLLKDKVQEGSGVLIIEEAPLSSRSGRGARRGLEGALDASMKAFGV